jgi:hypothetical protein
MSLTCISSFSYMPRIYRFGLLIFSKKSYILHLQFLIILSLSECSNSSTLFPSPDSLFLTNFIQLARLLAEFLSEILDFSFPEFQFDFFPELLCFIKLFFLLCIVFFISSIYLNYFVFIQLFICIVFEFIQLFYACLLDHSYHFLLNSLFEISSTSQLLKSFIVELLNFRGRYMLLCFSYYLYF